MPTMTQDDIVALLKLEIQQAQGYESDVLAENREKALDYYFGNMQDTPAGKSNIVSTDVADTVNSLMAQASGIFRASSVEFPPIHEQDEPQAQLESDVIQYIIEMNDEYQTFDCAAFDALLQANGWIKVEYLNETKVEEEEYTGDDPAILFQALQPKTDNESIDIIDLDEDNNNMTIERTTTKQRIKITSVSPDVMLFSPNANYHELQDIRFIAERHLYTVSDLIDMEVSEQDAKAMPNFEDEYWPAIVARESEYAETTNEEQGGHQDATELKETYICYIMLDDNDNGTTERRRIHIGGNTIISDEPAKYVNYVTGSPLPIPHRITGRSIYDLMREVQDGKTHILRQYMDNLKVMNRSRLGYIRGEVNKQELLDYRVNGVVGCDRPESIFPIPANDIGPQAVQGLQYLDSIRTARGGASVDMNNAEMQLASSSAMAAGVQAYNKEMMAGYYCKNLAHSLLKNVFLLVHKILRREWEGPLNAKLRGKWVQTNPQEWVEREHAMLRAGMTNSEKTQRAMALQGLMAQQQEWLQLGQDGEITDKGKVYNAAADWIRTQHLGNVEEYLIDPMSPEAKQAAQQKDEQTRQQQQAMQQQQNMLMQMQTAIENMKNQTDRWQHETELRFKYYDAELKYDTEEAKLTLQAIENEDNNINESLRSREPMAERSTGTDNQ